MSIRHGYLARLDGVEYQAAPAVDGTVRLYVTEPADGFTEVRPGRHVRSVPAEAVELTYVRTTCTWRGAPFLVIGAHDEWLRLEYLGEDESTARELGLEPFDVAVYQGWAPRAEVTDLGEQHI